MHGRIVQSHIPSQGVVGFGLLHDQPVGVKAVVCCLTLQVRVAGRYVPIFLRLLDFLLQACAL